MRLSHWPLLFVFLLIPLLHRWWLKRNRAAGVSFPFLISKSLSVSHPFPVRFWLKYLGLALLVFALARPQTHHQQGERTVSGVDIIMALDVSASMNIEDLTERSRLDEAKDTLENFIQGRQNDHIGLVIFSGEPLTMAPPTLDYGLLLKALKQTTIGVLKDGTAIGDGLTLAISHLRESTAKSRVIILLTDGDNNLGHVDPGTAGELAAGYGIRVYTIAIGREGRVKMPIHHKGLLGNTVTTYQWYENTLNPELLQLIANTTHGKFYRVTDLDTLSSVFKEIDQLEKSEIKSKVKILYDEVFQSPLKWGAILLGIEQILSRVWWRMLL